MHTPRDIRRLSFHGVRLGHFLSENQEVETEVHGLDTKAIHKGRVSRGFGAAVVQRGTCISTV